MSGATCCVSAGNTGCAGSSPPRFLGLASCRRGSPCSATNQPWIGAFCRRVMELNFALDQDINQPDKLTPILAELGLPAADILDQSRQETTKLRLREQTEQARTRGIFGAPTFFVGMEMFWGNDRMDDALLFAADREV